mgnify:CR=1 FL=1
MSEDTTAAERTTVTTVSARPTIRVALPQGWARAVLSGIEAALLGWALVVVPTLIAYAAVASNQWLVSTTWEDAFHFASDLWGAALGAQVVSGGVFYRAVPLLFVLVLIGLTKLLLLQGRRFPAAAQWMAVPGFAVTALLLAGGIGTHVRVLGTFPLAIAIPLIAAAWEVALAPHSLELRLDMPQWLSSGVRLGWRASWVLAAYGGLFLLISMIVSWSRIRGIHELLLPTSTIDSTMITLAQVLFIPNAIVWALSWLAGPGFFMGSDALHSPASAPTMPIPAIPLFGATPVSAPGNWVVFALIVFGVALGVYLRLRKGSESLLDDLYQGGIAAVVIAAVYLVTSLGSAVVLGNGRLAFLGPRMSLSALCLFAEVALGILLTVAVSHPVSVAWARELVGAGKARVREHRHHEASVGAVAPAELAPEVPGEDVPVEETGGDSVEVPDGADAREDEVAENVADETQVAENSRDDADAAQASEEEDAPSN